MRTHKCRKTGCEARMNAGAPVYCPDHNNLNKSAVALGSIKSEKKATASKENGKLGGRPKTLKATEARKNKDV